MQALSGGLHRLQTQPNVTWHPSDKHARKSILHYHLCVNARPETHAQAVVSSHATMSRHHVKWIMHFSWVKGHAGIEWNELVDKLAKEAAVEDGPVVYDKIPREVFITRVKKNGLNMWQQQWTKMGNGAVTKAFCPSVRNRLWEKIPIFPEFTIFIES
jgi:hypothetical protein